MNLNKIICKHSSNVLVYAGPVLLAALIQQIYFGFSVICMFQNFASDKSGKIFISINQLTVLGPSLDSF